ncbi:MAG: urea ABC transporter permease subunit UrtB [Methylococcaceae bacterium]|nr:urea ABC transporter permease subunit UrtB [Methylococcaceae bacterium]
MKIRTIVISIMLGICPIVWADNHDLSTAAVSGSTDKTGVFKDLVSQLSVKSLSKKKITVQAIAKLENDRVRPLLEALLKARLFYGKVSPHPVYIAEVVDQGYQLTDAVSGQLLGIVAKRSIKKVRINNRFRQLIRGALAQRDLRAADAAVRLQAVKTMSKHMTPAVVALFREVSKNEVDEDIQRLMLAAVANADLTATDGAVRLAAIKVLAKTMQVEYVSALNEILVVDAEGTYVESDRQIIKAAKQAIKEIESRISWYENIQTLFFGLSLGSVLVLAAIGLAITFGVMGVINMAHGELIMLGAYTTYVVQLLMPEQLELSLFVAIPAAFLVSGLCGILIERGVIRHLTGRPLETLLATFGISLVLQQLVRSVFSPLNRSVSTPQWMSGSIDFNPVLSLTLNRLYILAFTLLVFSVLLMILKRTRLGLEVRAVSQNRAMAKAMGVKTERVDALTFGLGSGVAGLAGVALSQLTNVGPNLGQSYIVDSFMVVVFGGAGNLLGTLISGFSLGVATKFIEPYAGAVLAKILVLVFIIIFIQKRPRGLFPQKGRAAEG